MPIKVNVEIIADSLSDAFLMLADTGAAGATITPITAAPGGRTRGPNKAQQAANAAAENANAAAGGVQPPAPAGGPAGAAATGGIAPGAALTDKDVGKAVKEVDTTLGRPQAQALLAKYGAQKISQIQPAHYAALIAEANALLGRGSASAGSDSLD